MRAMSAVASIFRISWHRRTRWQWRSGRRSSGLLSLGWCGIVQKRVLGRYHKQHVKSDTVRLLEDL